MVLVNMLLEVLENLLIEVKELYFSLEVLRFGKFLIFLEFVRDWVSFNVLVIIKNVFNYWLVFKNWNCDYLR